MERATPQNMAILDRYVSAFCSECEAQKSGDENVCRGCRMTSFLDKVEPACVFYAGKERLWLRTGDRITFRYTSGDIRYRIDVIDTTHLRLTRLGGKDGGCVTDLHHMQLEDMVKNTDSKEVVLLNNGKTATLKGGRNGEHR